MEFDMEFDIEDFDNDNSEDLPHEVSELICLICLHRWVGVYPKQLHLSDMECKCGKIGYIIKTGQTIPDVEDEN